MSFLRRHYFALFILLYGLFIFFSNFKTFTSIYDPAFELDRYFHSQYYQGEKSDYILSDAQNYAVRAHQYLTIFQDPINILPGHPPLGTYLIGLSEILFKNPYVFSLLAGLLTLFIVHKLSLLIFPKHKLLAFLPILIISLDPLFQEQLPDSLLDIYLLLFVSLSLYFYFIFLKTKRFFPIALSCLFFGFAAATKFFFGIIPLFAALMITTVLRDDFKLFLSHTKALVFIVPSFLLGHFSYFYYHPSLLDFFRYQRYTISWWAGSPQVPPFAVFDLIFSGSLHSWWGAGEIIKLSSWWPILPLGFTLAVITIFLQTKKNLSTTPIFGLWLFLIFTILFFSISATYARHLLICLPTIYLLATFTISRFLKLST